MFEGCYSGVIASEGVTVCADLDSYMLSVWSWNIEVSDPKVFITLIKSLRKVMPTARKLIELYITYDLPQFVSTHNTMTRRVVRLNSLLKILSSLGVEYTNCEEYHYSVSFTALAKPLVDILKNVIDVLEEFRGECHRIRDRTHRFVYPVVRSVLEVLREGPRIYYSEWVTAFPKLAFEAHVSDSITVFMEVRTHRRWFTKMLSTEELERLFERFIRRRQFRFGRDYVIDAEAVRQVVSDGC